MYMCENMMVRVQEAIGAHLVEALDDLRGRLVNGADHSAAALRELLQQLHHLQARCAVQSAVRTRKVKGICRHTLAQVYE